MFNNILEIFQLKNFYVFKIHSNLNITIGVVIHRGFNT